MTQQVVTSYWVYIAAGFSSILNERNSALLNFCLRTRIRRIAHRKYTEMPYRTYTAMPHCMYTVMFLMSLIYTAQCRECDQPLHLTPYINQGDIETARNLSLVVDSDGVIPTSYAGFITVDQSLGNHLFFWFFPAPDSLFAAPLVIWLNGGPGISSMLGLFHENGPLKLKSNDKNNIEYERRLNSWADHFSMLYIDNPVGVGYSYTEHEGYRSTQDGYAADLFEFINQFYVLFPEYLNKELYIGGQSYAGKYVPAFAHRIHQEIQAKRSNISLTGIYLGGPYFDPETQNPQFADLFYSLGYISYKQLIDIKRNMEEFFENIQVENQSIHYYFQQLFPLSFMHDNLLTLKEPPYGSLSSVMNSENMKLKVHARNLTFNSGQSKVRSSLSSDFLVSTKYKMAELMDNYKVLIFTGDVDGKITSPMVEAGLMSTPWSLQSDYNNSVKQQWFDYSNEPRGFYNKVGRFCRVTVRGAGHQVPSDQPENTLIMMTRFVKFGCVQNRVFCH
ncbi:hypothetical protein Btru_054601 [Bulinus truncatus]|nr:hypothetical protein Btru_054601 [Bulinus truncatus]